MNCLISKVLKFHFKFKHQKQYPSKLKLQSIRFSSEFLIDYDIILSQFHYHYYFEC
jgi:hypothetical protein